MTTIHARVTRTECSLQIDGCLTSGMVGVPVSFEFGPEWKGLKKTAVFHAGTVKRDRINIERSTTVPAEVLQKPMENLYIGIYGYREDGTIVIPTVMAKAGIILRGANPSGDPGADPDLPIWAELEQRVSDLEEGSGDAAVKSVNGISPDENGNVEIKIPESSGSSVTIDPTLTQSGQAADAKAVGDAIANLDIPSIEGLATEEYVNEAIANIDFPSGGGGSDSNETWELLNDITVEEEVQKIDTGFWSKPQKKIRVVLDTLAADADTNYMGVSIYTTDANWNSLIQFYPVAMPRKAAERSYYEIECIGDAQALIGVYHSPTNNGFDVNNVARLSTVTGGKMILKPIDIYNEPMKDKLTGLFINTYGTFVAGTRLRIWGVAK